MPALNTHVRQHGTLHCAVTGGACGLSGCHVLLVLCEDDQFVARGCDEFR